jgi:hypothetical protein
MTRFDEPLDHSRSPPRTPFGLRVALEGGGVYAAANSLGMGGHQWGPIYLLIRAPLQLLLILGILAFRSYDRLGEIRDRIAALEKAE